MKRVLLVLALLLTGCTKAKPILEWTCLGCEALVSSGVCAYIQAKPGGPPIPVPECKPPKVLVIENWEDVSQHGATPVLGCEKP
jgi:hypothetical protein